MFQINKKEAESRKREGLTSYILLQEGDVPEGKLAVTWVDVEPGSEQKPHKHGPEQIYVIIAGRGLMRVGAEERTVSAGDLVRIPSDTVHSLLNLGDEPLSYVSASTPAWNLSRLYDTGQV